VALHVHLRLVAVRRRRERDHAEHARADTLGDGADGSPLPRTVAPLEYDDCAKALVLDPGLQVAQLGLELAQLLFVFLALELRLAFVWGSVVGHLVSSGSCSIGPRIQGSHPEAILPTTTQRRNPCAIH